MEAIRVHKRVERDGEIRITGLPCHKGQSVEMILLIEGVAGMEKSALTAAGLRGSGLVGLWKGRPDIADSTTYARRLREHAQRRGR